MKIAFKIIILFSMSCLYAEKTCDVLISGPFDFCDGLGRIAYGIIDQVSDSVDIRFHASSFCLFSDDPYSVKNRTIKEENIGTPGIFLYTNGIVGGINEDCYESVPDETVKIAYSMFEATEIPIEWVEKLNAYFDAVVVPDEFHINVYKNSGVTIPLFVIPTGLYLDKYFEFADRKEATKPFTFGTVSTNTFRKNLKRIINSFAMQYGNNPDYHLHLHVKYPLFVEETLEDYVESLGITNVEISSDLLEEDEFAEFLQKFDCYMLLSTGEGFSNTPREAMASGIPVIISDNTAQSTICNSGWVTGVQSDIPIEAWYEALNRPVGLQFDCKEEDAIVAMEAVVNDYSAALIKAQKAREWVKQYTWKALRSSYTALFKPQKVILGDCNYVDPVSQTVTTTDKNFYNKMNALK